MPLAPGTRIGSFEVIAALGAGGMGEVYRARDTKLDRIVALKVLPDLFTSDPERLARFEREAKVLASLNHPNIAQVYGFEGTAIAMELVEGPTLDEIIKGTATSDGASPSSVPAPLPLERALAIARQIATALEAAHDQGIVHRDLKPANVKVREDGTVKVLDFGLAKAFAADAEASASAVSNSPTLTARSTQLGMILGTAAYMSPEQAKGRAVDRRADVWAFGAVLFEMLAGRRAFEGDDVSDVLASVLKSEPEWSVLPTDVPAPVRKLIQRCLVKDPKRRLRDVAEGLLQMDEGLAAAAAAPAPGAPPAIAAAAPKPLWRRAIPIVLTAAVTAALMYEVNVWRRPAPEIKTPIRFIHQPATDAALFITQLQRDVAISPDGGTIAYLVLDAGRPSIWIRRLDQLAAARLRGGEVAVSPFVSADNAWIGFVDGGEQTQLKKVPILGGPPTLLTKTKAQVFGASWTEDHFVIIGQNSGPLQIVGEGGGEATPLLKLDAAIKEASQVWPYAVPGSSVVLFTSVAGSVSPASGGRIAAFDRATGRTFRSNIQGVHPRYVPSGHILYGSVDGTIRAVAFDPKTLAILGNPVPVVEGVGIKVTGASDFDVARDGRLIYAAGGVSLGGTRTLSWVERSGKETAIPAPARTYYYARISPDETRLSADIRDGEQNLWIWDIRRETLMRLTDKPGQFQYGLWTLTGDRVVFNAVGTDVADNLYQMRPDGTGQMERVTDLAKDKLTPYPNAITADGQVIFRASNPATRNDFFVASLTGSDRTSRKLLATEHDERNATLSPDGKWMAFESDLSGKLEIYVRPFPNVDTAQFPLSTAGGVKPMWSLTGREIFYLSDDSKMMAVPVDTTKGFVAQKPVVLFDAAPYFTGAVGRNYDVTRDGKRFLMIKNTQTAVGGSVPIVVAVDWLQNLPARVK